MVQGSVFKVYLRLGLGSRRRCSPRESARTVSCLFLFISTVFLHNILHSICFCSLFASAIVIDQKESTFSGRLIIHPQFILLRREYRTAVHAYRFAGWRAIQARLVTGVLCRGHGDLYGWIIDRNSRSKDSWVAHNCCRATPAGGGHKYWSGWLMCRTMRLSNVPSAAPAAAAAAHSFRSVQSIA